MKEWYLLNNKSRPNLSGGYEAEQFNDYKDDVFAEILESGISKDVLLCTSDLAERKPVKVIMQGRLADTQLKSMQRTVLLPIGTIKGGNYIFYKNCYWLATGVPDDNSIYEKCTLDLCQFEMKWQNSKGEIVSRWISATSASKYDMGENPYGNITTTTNNFTILIPDDEETSELYEKRVFLDVHKPPNKVFKITRDDGILYQYGDNGSIFSFIASKTELNLDTDNQELGICDYFEPKLPGINGNFTYKIMGDTTLPFSITNVYDAEIKDSNGYNVASPFEWRITTDCEQIEHTITDRQLFLSTSDYSSIGHSVTIELLVDGIVVESLDVEVISFL